MLKIMNKIVWILSLMMVFYGGPSMSQQTQDTIKVYDAATNSYEQTQKVVKTDEQWKKSLTAEQYDVTRHHGTERPFSGEYVNNHSKGIYKCPCCGLDLFLS